MKQATIKLGTWQRDQGLTDAEAGARPSTTRTTWPRWKNGEMIPGPQSMVRLFIAGVAEPNDFYDLPVMLLRQRAA